MMKTTHRAAPEGRVQLALLVGVVEELVGGDDLLEAGGGPLRILRVGVRMALLGLGEERIFDLLGVGICGREIRDQSMEALCRTLSPSDSDKSDK